MGKAATACNCDTFSDRKSLHVLSIVSGHSIRDRYGCLTFRGPVRKSIRVGLIMLCGLKETVDRVEVENCCDLRQRSLDKTLGKVCVH